MRDALSTYHPGVPLAYFACTVVLALVTRQPAFALVSALGAIVCLFLVRDRDEALTTLAWVLPLWGDMLAPGDSVKTGESAVTSASPRTVKVMTLSVEKTTCIESVA